MRNKSNDGTLLLLRTFYLNNNSFVAYFGGSEMMDEKLVLLLSLNSNFFISEILMRRKEFIKLVFISSKKGISGCNCKTLYEFFNLIEWEVGQVVPYLFTLLKVFFLLLIFLLKSKSSSVGDLVWC